MNFCNRGADYRSRRSGLVATRRTSGELTENGVGVQDLDLRRRFLRFSDIAIGARQTLHITDSELPYDSERQSPLTRRQVAAGSARFGPPAKLGRRSGPRRVKLRRIDSATQIAHERWRPLGATQIIVFVLFF